LVAGVLKNKNPDHFNKKGLFNPQKPWMGTVSLKK
jgi:hypothetical protein